MTWTMLAAISPILLAVFIGAASPGPSFVLVARTAVAGSRSAACAAALGMGIGGALWAALATAGLQVILIYAGWLYASLQLLGGAYLLVLAWRIWRGAAAPVQDTRNVGRTNILASLLVALGTQLSNPKTALVYAGLFAALLPPETPPALLAVLLPAILVVETGWYLVVALLFSAEAPRLLYLKGKKWVDRTAAAVMGLLGLRLMASSLARPWLTPAAG